MLTLLTMALLAPTAPLDRLEGCWNAPGQVLGKPTRNKVRGQWRMGGKYMLLEIHGQNPGDPYDAAILLAPGKKGKVSSFWMDSFGGDYVTSGEGRAGDAGVEIDYRYPDSRYRNQIVPEGRGWRWTITEHDSAGPDRIFAEYRLTPTACGKTRFAF